MRRSALLIVVVCLTFHFLASAQELEKRPAGQNAPVPTGPAKAPNADPIYQQLRNIGLSGETASVSNLVLKRDAGEFTFTSGVFQFLAPVNGKVTGAVFVGSGTFSMVPPLASEKHSLSLLTKEPAIHEEFGSLVLRFTDSTYEEIKKATSAATGAGTDSSELNDVRHSLRKKLHYNLDARILQDVIGSEQGGLFFAFIKGKKYAGRELYAIDPHGVLEFAPEEIVFQTWGENRNGVWAAFHFSNEYQNGKASGTERNGVIAIEKQKLDTKIEKSGRLVGDATTTIVAGQNGMRVLPLDLFASLRVENVVNQAGTALDFIQEDKNEDADFSVILPQALKAGESLVIRTIYAGKDAVENEGGGNYFPVARTNWFPNTILGNYANYEMSFRIPKGLTMVATGAPIRSVDEGDQNISEWKSEAPLGVAGFNFGKFKQLEDKGKVYSISSYANINPPGWVAAMNAAASQVENMAVKSRTYALGSMSTVGLIDKPLAEAKIATWLYTDYFGPLPYKRVAMTQQTACNFGQSWPSLVYLPICAYFDQTVRHQLGLDDTRGYWKVVAPHEVAHQWWGHTVGWASYRDQWMSEGFAELSASLFIQTIEKSPQEFIKFWSDEKDLLTEKSRLGFRAIDVGPVTLGYRLSNDKSGLDITRRLIYPKGAYILHMLRMMMWSNRTTDDRFKAMMKDFVTTYTNKPASTEDFKAMVEKHMTAEMDLDRNHKMDWFFDPFVYGTALPNYRFEHTLDNSEKGVTLNVKITQSNVDDKFAMLVPLYLELASGKVVRVGAATIVGNSTMQQSIPLGVMKEAPKRALINYFNDVLSTDK